MIQRLPHPYLIERSPTLEGAAVHLWRVPLGANELPPDYLALLSPEEAARAARFRHHGARDSYITCRAVLRSLLAWYGGGSPEALEISGGPGGKPRLRSAEPIHFNLSHAGGWGLMAFSRAGELGVDTKEVHLMEHPMALAESSFSQGEYESLRQLPPAQRNDAFFAIWTRKEAAAKALGIGIRESFRHFTVSADIEDVFPTIDWPGATIPPLALRSFRWGNGLAAVCTVAPADPLQIAVHTWVG